MPQISLQLFLEIGNAFKENKHKRQIGDPIKMNEIPINKTRKGERCQAFKSEKKETEGSNVPHFTIMYHRRVRLFLL